MQLECTTTRNPMLRADIFDAYDKPTQNSAIIVLSGQGTYQIGASDVFRPLICTQNNPFYTPLPLETFIRHLRNEYNIYCNESRQTGRNVGVLKIIIEMMAEAKRNVYENIFSSVEELESIIDISRNRGTVSMEYAEQAKRTLRNHLNSFEDAINFLSHYYSLLKDILYPVIGNYPGYNTSLLNAGMAIKVMLRPLSASSVIDAENIEYNRSLSRLLREDFSHNFNCANRISDSIIVILDHLSFEQAELFSWIWNNPSFWLRNNERLFIMCLQENYLKDMMRCAGFDGKLDKWYYLNHNDGTELEALFGEKLIFNTSAAQHTDYGGIISINRILKIPTSYGTHTVPVYRPKYSRTFFQELSGGEGLLKVRGEENEHEFRCIREF